MIVLIQHSKRRILSCFGRGRGRRWVEWWWWSHASTLIGTLTFRAHLALYSSPFFLALIFMVWDATSGTFPAATFPAVAVVAVVVPVTFIAGFGKPGHGGKRGDGAEEEEDSEVLHVVVVNGFKRGSQVMLGLWVLWSLWWQCLLNQALYIFFICAAPPLTSRWPFWPAWNLNELGHPIDLGFSFTLLVKYL